MNRKKLGAVIVSMGIAICQGVVPITTLAAEISTQSLASNVYFTILKSEAVVGDAIPVAVTANIPNTTVSEMTVYANQTVVGAAASGNWKGTYVVPTGSGDINFFAVIKTADGQTIRSNVSVVKVKSQQFETPTIDFVVANTTVKVGENVPVAVSCRAGTSDIKEVAIYADNYFVGSADGSNYKGNWKATESGKTKLKAIVTTADGKEYTSDIITVKVESGTTAPTIDFYVASTTAKVGEAISVEVSAKAGNSAIKEVAIYADNYFVGSADGSSYKGNWKAVGSGKVALKAVVLTADGKEYTSDIKKVEIVGETTEPTIYFVVTSTVVRRGDSVPVSVSTRSGASTVKKVAIYAGNELVGSADGGSYKGNWRATGNGKVRLKAIVTTADGKEYTSDIIKVKVTEKESEITPQTGISSLNVTDNKQIEQESTNTLSERFILTNNGDAAVDLSKVEIRYYYTSDGDQSQNFFCDYAGMNMKKSPWYIQMTDKIRGTITNDYYSIKINTGTLEKGSVMEIATRVSKCDWTNYSQSNDHSYKNGIVVLYDGKVVMGSIPR